MLAPRQHLPGLHGRHALLPARGLWGVGSLHWHMHRRTRPCQHGAVANGAVAAAVAADTPVAAKQQTGDACPIPGTPPPSSPAASSPPPQTTTPPAPGSSAAAGDPAQANPLATTSGFQLRPIHFTIFALIFVGGAVFATVTLQFTAGLEFTTAVATVVRRVAKSVAFRQLVVISSAILLLRYGMNNLLMALSKFSSSPVQWDKTKLFYILREVYQPLELLLFIAAVCTVSDAYVPSLIGVPRSTVSHVVKSILSTSFILGFASVVFNLKSRFCKENAWQAEMKGDVTTQRRWEAYDKLGTFVIYVMSFVLGIQALGLEVTSVLAIGGIGGLAIGLAGREICENLLNGFLIMSTTPFEVGDEITFFHNNKTVEGIVIDVGWYRTNVRSFEREVYVIPNAVFSKNIILNVSRKNREWRFYETLSLRVQDVQKANAVVQDIRRIVRNDTRVINKLHRRIFLDKITTEDARVYMSFYLEAANRDAFMAIKQDLLVSFVDCVERNGAKLAMPRTVVDMDPEMAEALGSVGNVMQGLSAYAMAQNMTSQGARVLPAAPPPTINAEATSVPSAGASSSSSSNGVQGTVVISATPVSPPAAISNGASSSSSNSPAGAALPGAVPAVADKSGAGLGSPAASAGGSPAKASQPSQPSSNGSGASSNGSPAPAASSGGGAGGEKASSGGTRVGDVYSAPQSTLVVSVPATGVPIAFAGSVSNNVVTATIPVTPLNGSSSKGAQGASSLNGAGGQGSGTSTSGQGQASGASSGGQQASTAPSSSPSSSPQASSSQQQGAAPAAPRATSPPATFAHVAPRGALSTISLSLSDDDDSSSSSRPRPQQLQQLQQLQQQQLRQQQPAQQQQQRQLPLQAGREQSGFKQQGTGAGKEQTGHKQQGTGAKTTAYFEELQQQKQQEGQQAPVLMASFEDV